ncbi:type II toxin-antitoxin system RelE/ParE family toxin [Roseobacter weihaiensis]|uniref:type II toxin-antitoxin system RelE/ParE family toxin n=1 Tax=Roseobacter weihaiensis TaxID=2763262 RepID=UPI001D09FBB7|nr:type II toxin-antitoxin system RelE/ParE family toxin [Roseobacter sp. H9]
MGTYRLSEEAKDDLIGIHQFGVREFGVTKADEYFWQLIQRFEVLAETPLLYQEVADIREKYRRSVCGVHSIYYRIIGEDVEIMAILRSQDTTERL